MSNEVRLLDFISGYARYYEVDIPDAAYALHELISKLYHEYCLPQGRLAIPDEMFWVGRADSSKRSVRKYKMFFDGVINYLDVLHDSVPVDGSDLIPTYSEHDRCGRDIPVSLIYLSRRSLAEWVAEMGGQVPAYMLSDDVDINAKLGSADKASKAKELHSVSLIINGLISLIKEVDRAHVETPGDAPSKKRAEAIRRCASALHSSRKNFDISAAVVLLAEAAEVDIRRGSKTLKKYMSAGAPDRAEGAA